MQPKTPTELPKAYDPAAVEARRYALWEATGVFHDEPEPGRPPFVISMPPPNITGRAHIGQGSTYTPMDILVRYHRMRGENAVWLPGQDHAAIATEVVVLRELALEGQTRQSLGRAQYLERVWRWREEYGGAINDQFRQLGFGPDWRRERFTMDDGLSAAVTRVFVELYREGLIYRGTRLVNWDPKAQSTLSDAEVEDVERMGFLWHIRYRTEDGNGAIEVATTRPETMLGDTAVAVHPDDERYRSFIGRRVVLPLLNRSIPVVADEAVDREFGTGAVKVTPAHDFLDNEIGQRHHLPMPSVIGPDGTMIGDVGRYHGMDRFAAREAIVADLTAAGALVKSKPHAFRVPISDRSGDVVEPLLSLQWFCRMSGLAEPALQAYRDGRIRFIPERHGRTYAAWLENIRDWNISRQIWWGHQLPVWYTPADDIVVAETEADAQRVARERYGSSELRRDPDTLDTWFSSGLWPFSILGWPAVTPELRYWYPNQVLVTGREIIFLWVARMVMLGMKFVGDVPFHDVLITPLVFDLHGRKMSKSVGNVIDPIELIASYGADAFRFGIVQQMRLESQELRFDERFCQKGRDFATKMWNALRFIVALPEGLPPAGTLPADAQLTLADRWILTRLHDVAEAVTAALDRYEFGVAADSLLEFIWYELCDWYIEASKRASSTRAPVLSYVMNAAMRLLHPICPFVSEEIWQALPHDGATIVRASWPEINEIPVDRAAAGRYEALMRTVTSARNTRSELKLPPRERLTLEVPAILDAEARALLALHANADIVETARAGNGSAADPLLAVTVRTAPDLLRRRLLGDLQRLDNEVERLEAKLSNAAFVNKASPDVVAKERAKLINYSSERASLRSRFDELQEDSGR